MVTLVTPTEAPVVHGPPQGRWTISDWEKLPDDGNRYEIIDGVLYMSTAPNPLHQWILQNLYDNVGLPAKQQGLGISYFSPIGVIMPGCDPVQPDFVFLKPEHKHIVQAKRLEGVPDLIVEILSPGNRAYDEEVKYTSYANAGVPEYAIIDPIAQTLRLHQSPKQDGYGESQVFNSSQTVIFAGLPTVRLDINKLFEGAPDSTP